MTTPRLGSFGISLALGASVLLGACSGEIAEKQRAQSAINDGLAKTPVCRNVPVNVQVRSQEAERSALLTELIQQGYVIPAPITTMSLMGRPEISKGYAFTEKAKPLIQNNGAANSGYSQPCFRIGVWKTKSIEAVDIGNDASGTPIATVRAMIEFTPEEWLATTKSKPEWALYWQQIKDQQTKQWLYLLLKSGNDFFYGGPGRPIS